MKARLAKRIGIGVVMLASGVRWCAADSAHDTPAPGKGAVPEAIIVVGSNSVANPGSISGSAANQPETAGEAPVRWSYGVPEIIKMAQANVGEDVITAFIENAGTAYELDAGQIIHLRELGVSDRLITAMLGTRQKLMENAAKTAPAAAPAPAYQASSTPQPAPSPPPTTVYTQPAVVYTQPARVYVQPAPTYAQSASSVYVIPYPPATYAYYGYYHRPYYYPYNSYYPRTYSFSLGYHHGYHFRPYYSFGSRYGACW